MVSCNSFFQFTFALDLFKPRIPITDRTVRFSLSSADAQVLLDQKLFSTQKDIEDLEKLVKSNVSPRQKALVGTYVFREQHITAHKSNSADPAILLALSQPEHPDYVICTRTHHSLICAAEKLVQTLPWVQLNELCKENFPFSYHKVRFPTVLND